VHGVIWIDLKEVKAEGVQNELLESAYRKLKQSEGLEGYERRAIENFTDAFVTVTRCVTIAGEEAVRIAEEVNWHSHSSSCKKGGRRTCRWKFPRWPLARTIFVDANREDAPPRMDPKEREGILDAVMRVLVEDEGGQKRISQTVLSIMHSSRYPNVKLFDEFGNEVEKESGDESDEESLCDENPAENENSIDSESNPTPSSQDGGGGAEEICFHGLLVKDKSGRSKPQCEECSNLNAEEDQRNTEDQESNSESPMNIRENLSQRMTLDPKKKVDELSKSTESPKYISEENLSQKKTPEPKKKSKATKYSEAPKYISEEDLSPNETPEPEEKTKSAKSTETTKYIFEENSSQKRTPESELEDEGPVPKKAKKSGKAVRYVKMEDPEEYRTNIRKRIEEVLKIASAGGESISYEKYEQAVVEQPRKGSEVILRRDIDEIMLNNYNPEWIVCWSANLDLSCIYDFYGAITYVTDYFTKDSTGTEKSDSTISYLAST
jgi:hypothetical protein